MGGIVLEKRRSSHLLFRINEKTHQVEGPCEKNKFRWMVAEEVSASCLGIFGKNARRKCKDRIDILRNVGKSSNRSSHVQLCQNRTLSLFEPLRDYI